MSTTRHDALVNMAMILLRARGQWQGGATAYADMDEAVNRCSDLIGNGTRDMCEAAIGELKQRSGIDAARPSTGQWPERGYRGT